MSTTKSTTTVTVEPTAGSEWQVACNGRIRGVYRDHAMATAEAERLRRALAADARVR